MSEPTPPERKAWLPLTPQGIARFASASLNRLLLVQLSVALIVAAGVIWFLVTSYSPVILSAIQTLPETAEISKQRLHGLEPALLAENKHLSIIVESQEAMSPGVGDVQLRLGSDSLKICSIIGCLEFPYPAGWIISLARSSVEPKWGAWEPMILAGLGLLFVAKLVFSWSFLAFFYAWIPRLVAFYADRNLSWVASWKLACAAQLPGALFAAMVIFLYGLNGLDLLRFLVFYGLHMPIGWIFLIVAPFFLPRLSEKSGQKNPFSN